MRRLAQPTGMSRDWPGCARRIAICLLTLAPVLSAPAHAGLAELTPLSKCATPIVPNAPRQWSETDKSMAELVKTGLFDIRAAYRMKLCETEFTVYVLQNTAARDQVYECAIDDTYRPIAACQALLPPGSR